MTALELMPRLETDTPAELLDRHAWQEWLVTNTAPDWRPAEWDARHWLFTGDPDRAETAIWRCNSAGCDVAVRATRHLCRSCYEQFVESGLSREEFATVGRRAQIRTTPGTRPTCVVNKDGAGCPRDASTRGVCAGHYTKWKYHSKTARTVLPLEEWALQEAEPLSATPDCLIGACGGSGVGRGSLCAYHRDRWRRFRVERRIQVWEKEDVATWAATQSPWLSGYQFSMVGLPELLRHELVFALAERDAFRPTLSPVAARLMIRGLVGVETLTGPEPVQLTQLDYLDRNCDAHFKDVLRLVRAGFDRFQGIDPLDRSTWELSTIGLTSKTQSGKRIQSGELDSTRIRQEWIRKLLADWIRETSPDNTVFRRTFDGCVAASDALHLRPGGGHDPSKLKVTDMDAVVEAIKVRRRQDGEPLGFSTKADRLRHFCSLLDFGRRLELLDFLASGFARQSHHVIPWEDVAEDLAGKAIPDHVMTQLDAAVDLIGFDVVHGKQDQAEVRAMLRTIYILLRDTGRRPWEIRWLRTDCLETNNGEYVLIWDNHKARRKKRRLEISRETAFAIQAWLEVRERWKVPARSRTFLFPAASAHNYDACVDSDTVSRMLRRWVDGLPRLDTDVFDRNGEPVPFDRSKIYPYAFRHTYAQRHADAGTDIHVLRALMDHKSTDTTMGYFRVSMQRRREAVEAMRGHVVDRLGRPMPTSLNLAYEGRSVAVPFGNCREPSNVKAGGKQCPIRFQCSGCGFYRPDPSFLPAVEDHIRALKADRETAMAMDAAAFVIQNFTDQIESFQGVVRSIHDRLKTMPLEERRQIEEAGAVLRKVRASAVLLPMPEVPARSDDR
ncbi:tyrosine-type recombinase/integrase [Streptomyces anulatus]|uniref:tyrosine-type recombinase/integrase n=1 Tax=Streptomyces anulatus TaxID=1892 RepID=UPI003694C41C